MGLDDEITAARRAYDIQVQATRSAISDELESAKRLNVLYDRLGSSQWRLKPDMGIWGEGGRSVALCEGHTRPLPSVPDGCRGGLEAS
ncbi:hypothetical protein LCGC14_0165180 [marine sediment metagenome]|uniref:Uncharacterized protein n=1 Tax=marine sediment metagenome TaxID=412755 RepID=A0A0F9UYS2_9ZZZZ